MKELREVYISIQMTLFPMLEEENIEISGKIKEFLELIETMKPARFLNDQLYRSGLGRPMKGREAIIRALMLKYVYNFPNRRKEAGNQEETRSQEQSRKRSCIRSGNRRSYNSPP